MTPKSRIVIRSKDGVELYAVPAKGEDVETLKERPFILKGSTTLQLFSPDGTRIYLHKPSLGVAMCRLDGSSESSSPFLEGSGGVQMLATSPKGNFLLSWERLSSADPTIPNLKIWDAHTGKFLHGFIQRNLKRDAWPYLQWTHDEKYAFLMVTNEIRVYPGDCFHQPPDGVRFVEKMRCPGVSSISVPKTSSSESSYLVSSFVPKSKDKPARASLHRYPSPVPKNAASYPALITKSLFQAEEVSVHWSPTGDAALMALQASVDTSGESYYGSTTLFLMHGDAKDAISVALPNNSTGPVLNVGWMPNPNKPTCFAVISGRMPAMASLHHGKSGEPVFLFGNAHRNTISWSSHGRFLCLAGFGNLAGGVTFWDRNKQKPIPQYDEASGVPIFPEIVASCTVGYGWSPDSRMFGVSTTSPRMNVDNGVSVYHYNGAKMPATPWNNENYKPNKLLEAAFVPSLPEVYPDRAQSPAPKVEGDATAIAEAKKRALEAATKPSATSKGRYVPPSARGRSGGSSLAERMRREKEGNMMGATKVTHKPSVPGSAGKKLPIGLSAPQDQKSKSALRRERQKQSKAKKEEEEARQKAEKEAAEKAARDAAAADPEKRARKLKKSLKQIEDLKTRDSTSLNDDQKKKIATEAEVRAELQKLGV